MDVQKEESFIIEKTQTWLTQAVIGLNLCPFAKAPHVKGLIAYRVSQARDIETLVTDLHQALEELAEARPDQIETTLLIHPWILNNFMEYNDFLELADELVEELDLAGILQVASFHPDYQFAGTHKDDISNYTNRSPYPTLHLIREESIDKAVEAFPEAEQIYETNIATMEKLGVAGWEKLFKK